MDLGRVGEIGIIRDMQISQEVVLIMWVKDVNILDNNGGSVGGKKWIYLNIFRGNIQILKVIDRLF